MKLKIVFILIGLISVVRAQELNLVQLSDSLKKNNPQLKQMRANSDMALIRRQSSSYLGATSANFQYGQINTKLQDIYYEVDQEIKNPFSTTSSRKVNAMESDYYAVQGALLEYQLLKQLKDFYYQALYYQGLLNIYEEEYNLYADYLSTSDRKLAVQEISASDYALIRIQSSQLNVKVQNTERSLHETDEKIREICGVSNNVLLDFPEVLTATTELPKSYSLPLSERFGEGYDAQQRVYDQQISNAKLSYLPNLSAGYFNQTIEHERGYQGLKLGLNFSILDGSNKQMIRQANLERSVNTEIKHNQLLVLQNRLENARHHLNMYISLLNDIESSQSSEEEAINNYAEQGKKNGEISPLEYVQLRQKRLEIQLIKQEIYLNINQFINELEYLTK